MSMTMHSYRPRQFHRASNGENPSNGYRDMGSASLADRQTARRKRDDNTPPAQRAEGSKYSDGILSPYHIHDNSSWNYSPSKVPLYTHHKWVWRVFSHLCTDLSVRCRSPPKIEKQSPWRDGMRSGRCPEWEEASALTSRRGPTPSVRAEWPEQHTAAPRIWCRVSRRPLCYRLITTGRYPHTSTGRVSLSRNGTPTVPRRLPLRQPCQQWWNNL